MLAPFWKLVSKQASELKLASLLAVVGWLAPKTHQTGAELIPAAAAAAASGQLGDKVDKKRTNKGFKSGKGFRRNLRPTLSAQLLASGLPL